MAKLKARKAEIETQIEKLKQNITVLGDTKLNPSGINKFDLSTTYFVKPPSDGGTLGGGNQDGGMSGGEGFNYAGSYGS